MSTRLGCRWCDEINQMHSGLPGELFEASRFFGRQVEGQHAVHTGRRSILREPLHAVVMHDIEIDVEHHGQLQPSLAQAGDGLQHPLGGLNLGARPTFSAPWRASGPPPPRVATTPARFMPGSRRKPARTSPTNPRYPTTAPTLIASTVLLPTAERGSANFMRGSN